MPEKTTSQEVENINRETVTTQTKKIGGTTYTVNSHYHGTETYEDIVKSVLKQEIDKEQH